MSPDEEEVTIGVGGVVVAGGVMVQCAWRRQRHGVAERKKVGLRLTNKRGREREWVVRERYLREDLMGCLEGRDERPRERPARVHRQGLAASR